MSASATAVSGPILDAPLFDPDPLAEHHRRESDEIVTRTTVVAGREVNRGSLRDRSAPDNDAVSAFEQSWLRNPDRPDRRTATRTLRVGDLFCGVGGLSVGLEEATWALGLGIEHALAADLDKALLGHYEANFGVETTMDQPIETAIDGELGSDATLSERRVLGQVGELDLILAGPPCQGHSDLNNHTRRNDPRNALYERTVRAVELFAPRYLLIENVPGVLHDRGAVVERSRNHLEELGYAVDTAVVRAEEIGVPQRRRRFFLLASRVRQPSVAAAVVRARRPLRPVTWALEDTALGEGPFATSARHSEENQRRIAYLFANGLHEMPDSERPPCHRDKPHSYRSVYGRMRPDEPSPTITVGFGSTGQGRFVHPSEPRTLTPHEAARVQTFPDWFDFRGLLRTQLQKAIGNAVPPMMASAVLRELLVGELL